MHEKLQSVAEACTKRARKDPRYIQHPLPMNMVYLDAKFIGRRKDMKFCSIPKIFTQLRYSNLVCVTSYGMPQEKMLQNTFETLNTALKFLKLSISMASENHKEKNTLEFYDFKGLQGKSIPGVMTEYPSQMNWLVSPSFLETCCKSVQQGIKLLNVDIFWFCQRFCSRPEYASPELGLPIVSLVNIHPYVKTLDMSNLEKITIPSSFTSVVGNFPRRDRPEWPALKILDINVDERSSMCWDFIGKRRYEDIQLGYTQPTSQLFEFLFRDVVRSNMTELILQFSDRKKEYLTIPKLEDIATSCQNLKKLKICNWPGTNKALVNLWNGLGQLEDISLEYCKNLGNVAFVGSDVNNPVFLGLKSLKTLSLKGLDQMSKVTDTLFTLVLCRMKLSNLIITSDEPLKMVTHKGISSLLEGPFAGSIEKFPFNDWSLERMSDDQFKGLEKQFRSYNMV